ncbi:MAG: response regulator transcription factor [Gammaproteobacteria bacterium]|nr:response regulator transcription factor [Gammaproteobacteria bacterium]
MNRRILIVEDQADIANLIKINLDDLDCQVEIAADGREAAARIQNEEFDLFILDLMLPHVDGLELCRKIRTKENYVPVLMLTAKSEELDRVLGLEMGADDYMTKPFSVRELTARVKALFRRGDAMGQPVPSDQAVLVHGNLTIDISKHAVTLDGKSIELTAREFDLLVHFVNHPGRVYTRAQLLDTVWGYSHDGYEHTVNSHINRLRTKIEYDASKPKYILTVWGVGYKFAELEANSEH